MIIKAILTLVLIASLGGCAPTDLEPADLEPCKVAVDPRADADALQLIEGRCNVGQNMDLGRYNAAYERYSLAHRATSLHTQRWYGIITMSFVVLLVVSGITLTFLEFTAGHRGVAKLKLAADGLEVDSKFLGITVLVISLAFAYLFLEKAFKIEEIRSADSAEVPAQNATASEPDAPHAAEVFTNAEK